MMRLPFSSVLLCAFIPLALLAGCRIMALSDMPNPPLEQIKINDGDISNWTPEADAQIYVGTQLFDYNDGGAPQYLEKGCIKTSVQRLNGQNGSMVESMIMDFGKQENAIAMFQEKQIQNAGRTISHPEYADSVVSLVTVLGGVHGFTYYGNFYFEIIVTGFSDIAQALQTFDLFFGLYRKKINVK
ncbi:MAG: hypothetical protein JXA71_16195 [Chitinispirillaceae bacterium]|nr:hypothetical protein [Chitinispirillaceae bacterium]